MQGRQPLVAGNWKMNGLREDGSALARALAQRARQSALRCEVAVCPPATLLEAVGRVLAGSGIALGAQDCHTERSGAFTGDVSAVMLADAGCRYVILGHSERRAGHGETDELVRAKAAAAHAAGLVAIVCIGETEAERQAGQTLAVVGRQLAGSLPPGASAANTVIAYEPVWAIGTGRTPTPADVREVHAHLRTLLRGRVADGERVRILYGGSVKPENAASLLAIEDVDGALVGGASLKADDFWRIAQACP
ncbi:MAG: triose-phosphate isomerase [Rhodospirillaceae bacterium]|nr:triose-phosphate isomerase [Rhodospirillaceae bacterium]